MLVEDGMILVQRLGIPTESLGEFQNPPSCGHEIAFPLEIVAIEHLQHLPRCFLGTSSVNGEMEPMSHDKTFALPC